MTAASAVEVIGFGALNVDHLFRVDRILSDSEAQVKGRERAPGGSAANTIYGLAKLGIRAGFIGAVGDDEGGRLLMESFRSVGVDTSRIRVKEGVGTGSALCFISEGKRAIYVEPGANSLIRKEDLDLDYASKAKMIHLSSFVDDEQLLLQKEFVAALPKSVKISFAPGTIYAHKGLDAIRPILERAQIVFLNSEELKLITGADLEEGARELRACGSGIVAVTLGEEGSYLAAEEGTFLVEPVRADKVMDPTGAGDAYAAGLLYGLLMGKDLRESARLGHLVASLCISQMGARAGLPSREELKQAYEKLY